MKPVNFIIFGFFNLFFLLFATYISGTPIFLFLDFASIVMLLVFQVSASLAYAGPKGFVRAFTDPFAKTPTPADLRKALSFWKGQTALNFLAAFLGLVWGVIIMMQNLADKAAVGVGTALALLIVFYALALNILVIYPYRLLCERRLAE